MNYVQEVEKHLHLRDKKNKQSTGKTDTSNK